MAKGIRSYGPGKFNTILDSHAYELTLTGVDEEATYPQEGSGWFGLIWLDASARDAIEKIAQDSDDALTEEEEDLLDESEAVVFFERSDGIVEVDWFDKKKDAEKAWDDILADTEGEDEDEDDEEEAD